MRLLIRTVLITLAVGTAAPVAAQSASPRKIDKALTQSLDAGCSSEQVIIRTKPGYRAGVASSLKAHGNKVASEHPSIEAVSAEVDCDDLRAIERFTSVLSISKNALVRSDAVGPRAEKEKGPAPKASKPSKPSKVKDPDEAARLTEGEKAAVAQEWLFETLGVQAIRTAHLSSGRHPKPASVGVAVIDSGIAPGLDFGDRLTAFYDFTQGRVLSTVPSDVYGHGTHVAGLIGSRFVGIDPSVRLVGLKVLDGEGYGRTSDVIRAIEFAVANRAALGIDVLNLALGHPIYEPAASDPLVQAVESAVRAGLVVVTSAGNFGLNLKTKESGYGGTTSPGNAPSAITVGAIATDSTASRIDDRISKFSSRGPTWYDGFAKPDVAAPGQGILSVGATGSVLRKHEDDRGGKGNYLRLSGTSIAAGLTSGLVALVLDANPRLTPNALKAVLEFTALAVKTDEGEPLDVLTQGAGGINGAGSIELASAIDAWQPVGSKWLSVGVQFHTTIAGETLPWAQFMIWGSHRAYGWGVIDENRPAWATNIVWGEDVEDEDNIVWGTLWDGEDNIVWGTAYDEGDNIVWGTNVVWDLSLDEDNIVWGTSYDEGDNIVWGTNIVWGSSLLGTDEGDNIVWGTFSYDEDNIVWGTLEEVDNITWGTSGDDDEDNIVWGTNIIWGDRLVIGSQPESARKSGGRY
jgi:serine protease AprX